MSDLINRIKKAQKEDKIVFGYKEVTRSLLTDDVELIVVASNVDTEQRRRLEQRKQTIALESVPIPNNELGTLCKRSFPVSILAIRKH